MQGAGGGGGCLECCDGLSRPGQDGATPLLIAALEGQVEAVRELVKAGAKIEAAMTVGGGGSGPD